MGAAAVEELLDQETLVARVAVAPLLDLEGRPVTLRDYWRDGPVVNVLVRHFGCLFCKEMVADTIAALPQILARGATLVLVGNGSLNQARRFYEEHDLPSPGATVLTDPDRNTYRAAEMRRGHGRTFLHPGSARSYVRARSRGHSISGVFGDVSQLGGVLITVPPALLRYLHRSRHAGDHPDPNEILAALD